MHSTGGTHPGDRSKKSFGFKEEVKPSSHKRDIGKFIPHNTWLDTGCDWGWRKGCNNTMIDDNELGSPCFGRGWWEDSILLHVWASITHTIPLPQMTMAHIVLLAAQSFITWTGFINKHHCIGIVWGRCIADGAPSVRAVSNKKTSAFLQDWRIFSGQQHIIFHEMTHWEWILQC